MIATTANDNGANIIVNRNSQNLLTFFLRQEINRGPLRKTVEGNITIEAKRLLSVTPSLCVINPIVAITKTFTSQTNENDHLGEFFILIIIQNNSKTAVGVTNKRMSDVVSFILFVLCITLS